MSSTPEWKAVQDAAAGVKKACDGVIETAEKIANGAGSAASGVVAVAKTAAVNASAAAEALLTAIDDAASKEADEADSADKTAAADKAKKAKEAADKRLEKAKKPPVDREKAAAAEKAADDATQAADDAQAAATAASSKLERSSVAAKLVPGLLRAALLQAGSADSAVRLACQVAAEHELKSDLFTELIADRDRLDIAVPALVQADTVAASIEKLLSISAMSDAIREWFPVDPEMTAARGTVLVPFTMTAEKKKDPAEKAPDDEDLGVLLKRLLAKLAS